jgi:hypothetical protein
MFIKMDTDNVRAMSSRMRKTADLMDARLVSINQVVTSAGWQSQAREEFIMHLESVRRSTAQSSKALRLMAAAADEKANQWEAIGNIFNGPFYFLRNVWGSVKNFIGGLWGGIKSAISSIRMPSLPVFIFPPIGAAIAGWFNKIVPDWDWNPPDWWPFKPKTATKDQMEKEDEGEEKNKKTSSENTSSRDQGKTKEDDIGPVEPVGLDQDDPRWGDEIMGDNGKTIDEAGCLITSVAMIARFHGADVTPADVNAYMKSHGGYVKGTSNMYWGSAEAYLESVLGKDFTYKGISGSNVSNTINSGSPVLLHVQGSTSDGHWVLATGVDSAGNYIVYESGTGKQSTYSPSQLHTKNDHKSYI